MGSNVVCSILLNVFVLCSAEERHVLRFGNESIFFFFFFLEELYL